MNYNYLYLLIYIPLILSNSCNFKTSTSTYDLTPLTLYGSSYSVNDIIDTNVSNYTFLFNICNNVKIPSICPTNTLAVPAYQISNNECYTLAQPVPNNISLSLIDITNPAKGIK